jgi:REP element-mobilizing transposase RayT
MFITIVTKKIQAPAGRHVMPNTYSQLYVQIVFAVKGRQNLISKNNREELHKYITGIVQNREQKMLAIFCMPDHIHVFVNIKPSISISDLVRDIKANSTKFINERNWIKGKFNWQEGFGAFSYSKSHIGNVINYILNQEEHHKAKTFKTEYLDFLEKFEIEYNEKYLFEWIE